MKPASYMLISALFFASMGAIVKFLSHLPFYELVLFRSLIILALCLPQILRLRINFLGDGDNRKTLLLRGIFGTLGLTLYYWTIQNLDFGIAVTIQYTSPIFTIFIASYVLDEEKSRAALFWMFIALIGVATIYQFNFTGVNTSFLALGLLAAFFSGCAYNCISRLKGKEHPQVIMLFFPLVTIPIIIIPSMMSFIPPEPKDWVFIIGMGVSTYLAQLFLTKAYQAAPASKVAVYGNFNVLMALVIGTLVFDESIDVFKVAGASLIVLSVFFVQRSNVAVLPSKTHISKESS